MKIKCLIIEQYIEKRGHLKITVTMPNILRLNKSNTIKTYTCILDGNIVNKIRDIIKEHGLDKKYFISLHCDYVKPKIRKVDTIKLDELPYKAKSMYVKKLDEYVDISGVFKQSFNNACICVRNKYKDNYYGDGLFNASEDYIKHIIRISDLEPSDRIVFHNF